MAIALQNQIERLRFRLLDGPLGQFFKWWFGELRDLLPDAWRKRLVQAKRSLFLELTDSNIVASIFEAGSMHEIALFSLAEDPLLHKQKLREVLTERELLEAPCELMLNEQGVLRREVVLPLAAEAGMRQALAYEMDRQTPYRVEDVYFAFRTVRRDRDASQVRVELLVTPKDILDRQLALLAPRGLMPSAVDVKAAEGPVGVNMLPPDMRHKVVNWRARVNWALGGVFLLMLAGVMAQSLWLRQHQLEELESATADVRDEAMRVQQIRQQIEDASEAAGFMGNRRQAAVPTVKLLAEVTRVLPRDTYLDRLAIGEGAVQMQGKSSNAQRLIEMVNNSEFFDNAAFRGPTRLDSRTQKEIFDMAASINLEAGR